MMNSRIGAIVVAAGTSSRFGTDKIFMSLAGKPVLSWSVDTLQNFTGIDSIVIVLSKSNISKGAGLVKKNKWNKVSDICPGGKRRQDSVKQGLLHLKDCDWVIIHDGARPFINKEILETGLKAARETGSAICAVPVKDTVKEADAGLLVKKTFRREYLWAVQTPQIFRFDIIAEAHEKIKRDVTDDAAMVEKLGYKVKLFEGSYSNIKITTGEDLVLAGIIAGSLK